MKSRKIGTLLCVLAALLFTVVALAQTGNQASLEGTMTDSSGAVVPAVTVKLTNTGTGASFTSATNESGYFRFPVIPVGMYDLSATRDGFAPYIQKEIDVAVGAKVNLTISLAVAGQKESVVVTGALPVVETTRTQALLSSVSLHARPAHTFSEDHHEQGIPAEGISQSRAELMGEK